MYSKAESTIYLVDWGTATTPEDGQWEGTLHYASVGIQQQLVKYFECAEVFRMFHAVKVSPADDLESLVTSMFCVSHPDAYSCLQKVPNEPTPVLQWWSQAWAPRPRWQQALSAARASDYELLAERLQALLE